MKFEKRKVAARVEDLLGNALIKAKGEGLDLRKTYIGVCSLLNLFFLSYCNMDK
jgi:hypothetical protein